MQPASVSSVSSVLGRTQGTQPSSIFTLEDQEHEIEPKKSEYSAFQPSSENGGYHPLTNHGDDDDDDELHSRLPYSFSVSSSDYQCPERYASFWSRAMFAWLSPLLKLGMQKPLEMDDLWQLHPVDSAGSMHDILHTVQEEEERVQMRRNQIKQRRSIFSILNPLRRSLNRENHHAGTNRSDEIEMGEISHADDLQPQDRQPFIEVKHTRDYAQHAFGQQTTTHPETSSTPQEETYVPTDSVLRALLRIFWLDLLKGGPLKLTHDICQFVGPVVLNGLLGSLTDTDGDMTTPLMYCLLLLCTSICQTLLLAQYYHVMYRVGIHIRATLVCALYKKGLQLSAKSRNAYTTGEIVNMAALDSNRCGPNITPNLHLLWSGPFQIIVAVIMLYRLIGLASLAGFVLMVTLLPLNVYLARLDKSYKEMLMSKRDSRIRLMNEIVNGIKQIKLSAWEDSFCDKLEGIRTSEMHTLRVVQLLDAFSTFLWQFTPVAVGAISFSVMARIEEGTGLTPARAFSALALFNILRFPLNSVPSLISSLIEARVSSRRIEKFLIAEDVHGRIALDSNLSDLTSSFAFPVAIVRGSFCWDLQAKTPILHNLDITVNRGELVCIVGKVGAGKSSLLQALLGEMEILDLSTAEAMVAGTVSYASQTAWIMNDSLRGNVTLELEGHGSEAHDPDRYAKTIEACALTEDIAMMEGGDLVEIGERGINLSGGQKARVALARAVYRNADIYLFDDPLSAVDPRVCRDLFENAINGPLLRGKTRILVTHHTEFLPFADRIIVLDHGNVVRQGTFRDIAGTDLRLFEDIEHSFEAINPEEKRLAAASMDILVPDDHNLPRESHDMVTIDIKDDEEAEAFRRVVTLNPQTLDANFMHVLQSELSHVPAQIVVPVSHPVTENEPGPLVSSSSDIGKSSKLPSVKHTGHDSEKTRKKLIESEERATGQVSFSVYAIYFTSIGMTFSILILVSGIVSEAARVSVDGWLSKWSDDVVSSMNDEAGFSTSTPAHNSLFYVKLYLLLALFAAFAVMLRCVLVAIAGLRAASRLHSKMLSAVIRAPMRFFDTTPVGRILNRFSKDQAAIDEDLPETMGSWLSTLMTVVFTLMIVIYVTSKVLFLIIPLSFVYMHISKWYLTSSRELKRIESISKSPLLAHFGESINGASIIRAFDHLPNFRKVNFMYLDNLNRATFLSVSSNRWLGVRLELVGISIVTFASLSCALAKGALDAGLAGLMLSYALKITGSLSWLVRMATDSETMMNSVERVEQYALLEPEGETEKIGIDEDLKRKGWPQSGEIRMENLYLSYGKNLEPALKGVNMVIEANEKVGVVGRTGAGKSSLSVALFRLVESRSGRIMIDGVNIADVGLKLLRSKLVIISQDPILFTGTIRENLDPFHEYADDDLWRALEDAQMKVFVSSLPNKLDSQVSDGGNNFSGGQRQLFCLARALLCDAKIVIIDEGTASVDKQTDQLIQQTIRRCFQHCTLITIAHRLNTIIDSDSIVVMKEGKCVEKDSPYNLLMSKYSEFSHMVEQTGPMISRQLRELAISKRKSYSFSESNIDGTRSFESGSKPPSASVAGRKPDGHIAGALAKAKKGSYAD